MFSPSTEILFLSLRELSVKSRLKVLQNHHLKFFETLASSMTNSQFNYCAIMWMSCSRKLKLRLENIHKRTLRVVFAECEKNYKYLLADHDERLQVSSCGPWWKTTSIFLRAMMKDYKYLLADHDERLQVSSMMKLVFIRSIYSF